jgi:hypothetical protein
MSEEIQDIKPNREMRLYAEVLCGIVRGTFEASQLPYGKPGICYVDVTDFEKLPNVSDEYNPAHNTFSPSTIYTDPTHPKNIEYMWAAVRTTRSNGLYSTDYTQTLDYPSKVMQKRYKKYRQELRDLPEKYSNPYDVVFPTEPNKSRIKFTFLERLQNVWDVIKTKVLCSR